MDRKIDEARSMSDYSAFLDGVNKLGINNELVWIVEAYYYSKEGEKGRAVSSLEKLKDSEILGTDERAVVDNAISRVGRGKDFDTLFVAKVVSAYIYSQVNKTDWTELLKEQQVPYAEEAFESVKSVELRYEQVSKALSVENLKEKGEDAVKAVKGLFE